MLALSSFARRASLTGVLSLGLSVLALMAQGQKYSVRELKPHSGGPESFAHSINKNGNIAGGAYNSSGLLLGTFWNLAGNMPTAALGWVPNDVYFSSVNNYDIAAGTISTDDVLRAVVMKDGGLWALTRGNYWNGAGNSIADYWKDGYFALAGRVFNAEEGSYPPDTDPKAPLRRNRAAVWNNKGDLQLLRLLNDDADAEYLPGNIAMSISNVGGLVGGSSAMKGNAREQAVVWAAWTNGIVGWLTGPKVNNGGVGGRVNHVRDNRYFCGYYYPNESSERTACYWPNYSTCVHIGSLYGGYSEALAVRDSNSTPNNRPEIVGKSEDPYSPDYHGTFTFAFRWNEVSGLKDLNDLIITTDPWVLMVAKDIDAEGRIVGWGRLNGQIRAFLLNPIKIKNIYFSSSALTSYQTAKAEIQMLDAVPTDTVISVRNSSSALQVPAKITVPRGQSRVAFAVTAGRVYQKTDVTLTFTLDDLVTTVRLTVNP